MFAVQEQFSQLLLVCMQIKPSNSSGYMYSTAIDIQKTYVLYSLCIYVGY
jgi:hypothetical protein